MFQKNLPLQEGGAGAAEMMMNLTPITLGDGNGEWVLGLLVLIGIMVAYDRLRGRKPGFKLSNYNPEQQPGKFKVSGVDRKTKRDCVWYCQAASAENAKAKAELEGIVVTRVDRQ